MTPQTVAHQAPPSMGFSRQEYWSGLPCPSPGHLPDPGIEPGSPALQADALPSEPPGEPAVNLCCAVPEISALCLLFLISKFEIVVVIFVKQPLSSELMISLLRRFGYFLTD